MMERTDRHFRFLLRLITPHAWLYTEMITSAALLRGARERLLAFDPREHPVAVQLGGGDPRELAAAARYAADAGYDEINLNVGCPSDRVQAGSFGAALMRDPARVADCVSAMRAAQPRPVTVKTRLGVDDDDGYDFLHRFATTVREAGCETLIVHARKACLTGLSPKRNREVPPLRYERVHCLKQAFPELEIVINGGLDAVEVALAELESVDGVMLGRTAYAEPWLLARLEEALFATSQPASPWIILERYLEHVEAELARGTPLRATTRHLTGLMARRPGARRWRRLLAELPDGVAGLARLAMFVSEESSAAPPTSRYNSPPGARPDAPRAIEG